VRYDWLAALVFVAVLAGATVGGRALVFRIPALRRMRELNREADQRKLSRESFREAVRVNSRAGLVTNLVFYAAILPFCVNLEPRPLWRQVVDVVAVLLVFDFLYYLTHRFAFHGPALRKIHALHHRAHHPTYVDALYVHPVETIIGLLLFLGSIPLVASAGGGPLGGCLLLRRD